MIHILAAITLSSSASAEPKANAFLAALDNDQRQEAVLPYTSERKFEWHFVPRARHGVSWKDLAEPQRRLAHNLLKASLSDVGYARVEAIRALEPILSEIERGNPSRDEDLYFFSFFGTPTPTGTWGWRYEGHHLSLSFFYSDGRLISSTPQFLGSNPARHPKDGSQILGETKDLAFKLVKSLDPDQMKLAVLSERTFGDIVTGNTRRAMIESRAGLRWSKLTDSQQALLLDLMRAHTTVQSREEQARRMKQIESVETRDLVFAWAGKTEPDGPHYYRILGKDLLIEYDNTQNNGNHIHTVWRNRAEDFGGDPLVSHYEHSHRR